MHIFKQQALTECTWSGISKYNGQFSYFPLAVAAFPPHCTCKIPILLLLRPAHEKASTESQTVSRCSVSQKVWQPIPPKKMVMNMGSMLCFENDVFGGFNMFLTQLLQLAGHRLRAPLHSDPPTCRRLDPCVSSFSSSELDISNIAHHFSFFWGTSNVRLGL